jgi:hypothetical protein
MNKHISNYTKSKVLDFLEHSKNVSFIFRDANANNELDFIKDKILERQLQAKDCHLHYK